MAALFFRVLIDSIHDCHCCYLPTSPHKRSLILITLKKTCNFFCFCFFTLDTLYLFIVNDIMSLIILSCVKFQIRTYSICCVPPFPCNVMLKICDITILSPYITVPYFYIHILSLYFRQFCRLLAYKIKQIGKCVASF